MFTALITTQTLAAHFDEPRWAIVDCSFELADAAKGESLYRAAHLPGAVYAHLDRDLSGPKSGRNGRHPLPDMNQFMARLGQWGIDSQTQVVAYDQSNGMWASRLWWMLKYVGHTAVAVLDGGLAKWVSEGRPTRAGEEQRTPAQFVGAPRAEMLFTASEVERVRAEAAYRVIDSRAPERYRGEVEPIDPVAGHIPGAVNHYNLSNHNTDGTFLPPEILREKFRATLGNVLPENAVTYCGSGVAAAHNVLAMEIAGLPGAKVYAGSWSEWCSDPRRATEKIQDSNSKIQS